ncbi:MAG TPA: hypothetical protein VFY17_07850 [Pilimelia sp.]|nr:hypothetical protein [Pilimelia sp.]
MGRRFLATALVLSGVVAGCAADDRALATHAFRPGYLADKLAVVHLSTQSYETRQHGRTVFVRQDGTAEVFRTGGLDMGKLAADARRSVQVSELNGDTVVGQGGGTFPRDRQMIGFFAAWLPRAGYVTLFNAGQEANPAGYRFDARWRAAGAPRDASVPRYLIAAGACGDDVYAVAEHHGSHTRATHPVELLRLRFGERLSVTTVARWTRTADTFGTVLGRLGCAGAAVHFWYETATARPVAAVGSIDLRTGAVSRRVVRRYADRDEQTDHDSWHVDRSTHLHDGQLYHLDGQGGITAVALDSGAVRRNVALPLPPYRVGMALTYWTGHTLWVLHQPPDLAEPATLSGYDANSGAPLRHLRVRGLGALIEEGVMPHDLLVFG